MNGKSRPPEGPEALLEHRAFVRGLALRLLSDEHKADDVVQETWLAALRDAPKRLRSPKAWLARVVRNLALRTVRTDIRRAQREERAARPDREAGPSEAVERLAAQRRVVDAVMHLDEPYRSTLVLRFYEDLQPKQIAARTGVNAATVRTRLKRGLDLLRGRLDELHGGDRRSWCLALLPLVTPQISAATGAATAMGGVLLMSAKTKATLAAAVVLAAAVLLWFWRDAGSGPPGGTEVRAPLVSSEESARTPKEREPAPDRELRARPAAGQVRVLVKVQDPTGRPVSGARVEARRGRYVYFGGTFFYDPDGLKLAAPAPVMHRGRTGDDGTFVFDATERTALKFVVTRDGFARTASRAHELHPREEPLRVVLTLRPAFAFDGRVIDEVGEPISGALVVMGDPRLEWQIPENLPSPHRATTGDDGAFRVRDLGAGVHSVWVAFPGGVPFHVERIAVPSLRRRDIVVERGGVVRGRVTDPEGRALSGVRVFVMGYRSGYVFTDADGRYRLELPHTVLQGVSARKEGYYLPAPSPVRHQSIRLARGETHRWDLVLKPASRLRGTVRGPDGPLAGVQIVLTNFRGLRGFEYVRATTDEDGRYAMFVRPVRHLISVQASGFNVHLPDGRSMGSHIGRSIDDIPADDPGLVIPTQGGEQVRDFEMVPWGSATVRGVVRDPTGKGVGGLRVQCGIAMTHSRDSGAFEITGVPEGKMQLWAMSDVWKSEVSNVMVVAGKTYDGWDVNLRPLQRCRGRVVDADGKPVQGAVVRHSVVQQSRPGSIEAGQRAARRWMTAASLPVEVDGAFVLTVRAREVLLRAEAPGYRVSETVTVGAKRIPGEPVRLVLEPSSALEGVVVEAGSGRPVPGARVRVVPPVRSKPELYEEWAVRQSGAGTVVRAVSGPKGQFRLAALELSAFRLFVDAPGYLPLERAGLKSGEAVRLELSAASRIEGVVLQRGGKPAVGLEVFAVPVGSRNRKRSWGTSVRGKFRIEGLAPGRYRVTAGGKGLQTITTDPVSAGGSPVRLVLDPVSPGEENNPVQPQEGTGTVRGTVTDLDGGGIEGVDVYVCVESAPKNRLGRRAVTGTDGTFVVRGLPEGPYRVAVHWRSGPWQHISNVTAADAVRIRFGSVAGTLRDQNGRPLPGRDVRATPLPEAPGRGSGRAKSDGQGRFLIQGLPPGEVKLAVTGSPQLRVLRNARVRVGARDVDLRGSQGRAIAGRAVDEAGQSLAPVYVVIRKRGTTQKTHAKSAKDGTFRVSGLEDGVEYEVEVSRRGYVSWRRVPVRAGTLNLQAVLRRGLRVSGTLRGADGRILPDTQIRARRVGAGKDDRYLYLKTDEEGHFEGTGFEDVEYTAAYWPKRVLKAGEAMPEWIPCGTFRARQRDVQLQPKER